MALSLETQSLTFLLLVPKGRTPANHLTEIGAKCSSVNKMLLSSSVPFPVTFHAFFSECLSPPRVIFLFQYLASDSLLNGQVRGPINHRPAVHMLPSQPVVGPRMFFKAKYFRAALLKIKIQLLRAGWHWEYPQPPN